MSNSEAMSRDTLLWECAKTLELSGCHKFAKELRTLRNELAKPAAVPEGWAVHAKVNYPADEPGQRIIGWRVTAPKGEGLSASNVLPNTPFATAPQPPTPAVDVEVVRGTILRMKKNQDSRKLSGKPDPIIVMWADQLARAIGDGA